MVSYIKGRKQSEGVGRSVTTCKPCSSPSIVVIRLKMIRCAGHVARIVRQNVHTIYSVNPKENATERTSHRREDSIKGGHKYSVVRESAGLICRNISR
jgi:hypothetical protein